VLELALLSGLAAALLIAAVTLRRRRRGLELRRVDTRGLHEGEWFAVFASANELATRDGGGIVIAGQAASYAVVEGAVTRAWQEYAAANPPGTRKPYFRSIKVVLRDWHDRQIGREPV
jgi:hypothetical protein